MSANIEKALEDAVSMYGITQLKPKQREAMLSFLSGKDVFVTLPTGYGKSIIYGLLPVVFDLIKGRQGSIVVCISPLTSIMMDQRDKFVLRGISAEFVGEAQDDPDVVKRVLSGSCQLVFISPESIINNQTYRSMLLNSSYKQRMVALAVDEAHCVKTWGDEFRIAFAHIGELRSLLPSDVGVLALTATATISTLEAVKARLSMKSPVLIGLSPYRDNIYYSVQPYLELEELSVFLAEYLRAHQRNTTKTVVFCRRLEDTALLYTSLKKLLGKYFTYPAGYPNLQQFRLVDMYTRACRVEFKETILKSFTSCDGILRVVIATTAFSMGIDCPDIERIIHWGTPGTLEEYVQETGRAGRDGRQAKAILLYGKPRRYVEEQMNQYAKTETECRRRLLYKNFLFYRNEYNCTECKCCDVCVCTCEKCSTFD